MVHIDRDAQHRRLVRRDALAHRQRLTDRIDDGTVGRIHRMQRFDGKRYVKPSRLAKQLRDALFDLHPRARQIAPVSTHATDDQHEATRIEFGGVVQRANVAVDARAPSRVCRCGQIRRAAVPGHGELQGA